MRPKLKSETIYTKIDSPNLCRYFLIWSFIMPYLFWQLMGGAMYLTQKNENKEWALGERRCDGVVGINHVS